MHSAMVDNHPYQLNVWSYSVWSVINVLLRTLLPTLNLCDMISNLTFSLCEDIIKLCSSCCKHQQVNTASIFTIASTITTVLLSLVTIIIIVTTIMTVTTVATVTAAYCHSGVGTIVSCSGFSCYTFQPVNLCL